MKAYVLVSAVEVSILVGGGLVAVTLLRCQSAAVRHWVLAAVMIVAASLPLLRVVAPRWGVGAWTAASVAPLTEPGGAQSAARNSATADSSRETTTFTSVAGRNHPGRVASLTLPRLVLFGWGLGVLVALVLLAAGLARLRWIAARARPLNHPDWTRAAADISSAAGLRRPVRLLHSGHSAILGAWGWYRPVVLVPREATSWPREDVDIVLRHELAHIARVDWPLQLLAEVVRALNWFNPLAWIAVRRLRAESERACDDAVLKQGVAGADYAERLVGLARRLETGERWTLFPAPAMARSSSLERRVAAMLDTRIDRTPLTRSRRAVILCVALGLALPLAGLAAFAQEAPGTFKGTVLDPTGKPMDARVTLSNAASGIRPEIRTGKAGAFEFSGLPAGEYVVHVRQPGFKTLETAVTLGSDIGVRRDFTLQIGSIEEHVAVRVPDAGTSRPSAERPLAKPPSPRASCTPDPVSGGDILAPRKLTDAKPEYPAGLAGTNVAGDVVVEGVVGEDGTVRDLRIVDTPQPELGRALMAAVSRWLFEPTLLNCEPVPVTITVKARFEQ